MKRSRAIQALWDQSSRDRTGTQKMDLDEIDETDHIFGSGNAIVSRDVMAHRRESDMEGLAEVVRDAARSMSAQDIHTLVSHPGVVRSALAVAARTISMDLRPKNGKVETIGTGGTAARIDPTEADRRMESRTRRGPKEELLTSDEIAQRAGLKTRQSVHDWLKKGRIIGWSGAKRGYVFPAGQLDSRGRPLKGLKSVIPLFEDGYAAWVWLTTPIAALRNATPLALLQAREIETVLAAAEGDAQGDFA